MISLFYDWLMFYLQKKKDINITTKFIYLSIKIMYYTYKLIYHTTKSQVIHQSLPLDQVSAIKRQNLQDAIVSMSGTTPSKQPSKASWGRNLPLTTSTSFRSERIGARLFSRPSPRAEAAADR